LKALGLAANSQNRLLQAQTLASLWANVVAFRFIFRIAALTSGYEISN
jgi:hypothetical protein